MIYEAVIGIGTIIFLIFVWVLLMRPTTMLVTAFENQTPSSRFNVSVNQTQISSHYELGLNVLYFSLFFITFIIIIWIIKVSVYQQRRNQMYGG